MSFFYEANKDYYYYLQDFKINSPLIEAAYNGTPVSLQRHVFYWTKVPSKMKIIAHTN